MFNSPRLDLFDERTARNYIMNANNAHWERGISQLIGNGSFAYLSDRFLVGPGLDGTAGSQTTYSQSIDVPDTEAEYSIQASGAYVPDEEFSYIQRIESIFSKQFSGNKVSLGFQYKTDGCDEVRVKLQHPTLVDDFSSTTILFNQTIPIVGDDTWREVVLEGIDIIDASRGLQVHLVFITNDTGTITTKMAKLQINLRPTLEPFTLFGRDTVDDKMYCKRYFETKGDWRFNGATYVSQQPRVHVHFQVEKRVIPVVTMTTTNEFNAASAASPEAISKTGVDLVIAASDGNLNVVRAIISDFRVDAEL